MKQNLDGEDPRGCVLTGSPVIAREAREESQRWEKLYSAPFALREHISRTSVA
jgi:hypothetical protein